MTETVENTTRYADLQTRVASGVVMAQVAFVVLWLGGIVSIAGIAAVTGIMLWEFYRISTGSGSPVDRNMLTMVVCGVAAVLLTGFVTTFVGLAALIFGVVLFDFTGLERFRQMSLGILYIGFAMMTLVAMRMTPETGFLSVLWLICVVIAVDVGGYFAGRSFGGPKLWPAVSPKKTWSGTLGGLLLVLIVAIGFSFTALGSVALLIPLSLVLAVAAQGGDLLESAFKRRFGVKDSSNLIPGHGGFLDRLDGLMGTLLLYALVQPVILLLV